MISFKDVHIRYGNEVVIRGISFEVRDKEIYGIIGPNGSGKTTLLRAMLGIITPDKGEISVNGINVNKCKPKIATVFETSVGRNFLRLTTKEDLRFYSALYDVDVDDGKLEEILELVGLDPNKKLYTLSRGMWQRLYIARVLIPDFPIVVLDEPWLGLDVFMQEETIKILKKMEKTVILTAHEMPLVERACDRVMIINNGKKIVEGAVNDLLTKIDWRYKIEIMGEVSRFDGVKMEKKGDLKICYVKDLKSFLEKIRISDIYKIDVSPVSLEEAYLYLVNKDNRTKLKYN